MGYEPDVLNICGACYFFNGTCLSACPVGPYTPNAQNVCVLCQLAGLVNQNNACQAACDPGYYSLSGFCVTCGSAGLVDMGGVCQASCDPGFIDDPTGLCVPCNYDGATCVLNCPAGQLPDTSSGNLCKDCIFHLLSNLNGQCVADCGYGLGPDGGGICVTCQSLSDFVEAVTGDCVNPCPGGYIEDYQVSIYSW